MIPEHDLRDVEMWLDGRLGPVTPTGAIRALVDFYRESGTEGGDE